MPEPYSTQQWDESDALARSRYPRFFDALRTRHPNLNQHDEKLATLILLKRTSGEITDAFDWSLDSYKTACKRLRQHLEIKGDNLFSYLSSIAVTSLSIMRKNESLDFILSEMYFVATSQRKGAISA